MPVKPYSSTVPMIRTWEVRCVTRPSEERGLQPGADVLPPAAVQPPAVGTLWEGQTRHGGAAGGREAPSSSTQRKASRMAGSRAPFCTAEATGRKLGTRAWSQLAGDGDGLQHEIPAGGAMCASVCVFSRKK